MIDSTKKMFDGHLSHMETQLHAKIRKKYWTIKAVGPERTNGRTYERMHESEFLGSFRRLKTSGEPTRKGQVYGLGVYLKGYQKIQFHHQELLQKIKCWYIKL